MRSSALRFRVLCVAIIAVMATFLFAYPTQSLLAQQRQVDAKRHELDVVQRENRELRAKANRLSLASEIERVAREQFNMVRSNEHAYRVVFRKKASTKDAPERRAATTPTTRS